MARKLDHPLDLSREARHLDESGTPAAMIETARRRDDLVVLDSVDDEDIVVQFPMGKIWRDQTGCTRFVLLGQRVDGCRYALVTAETGGRRRWAAGRSDPS